MPHSFGLRARTRSKFSRNFREHGAIPLSTYLRSYKVGDVVDIKANAAVQKGMPHKFYHGRTGVIYNVTKSAVGVIINKRVGNRYIEKHVNLRVEHIKPSKSDYLKTNAEKVKLFKAKNAQASEEEVKKYIRSLKPYAAQPRESRFVDVPKKNGQAEEFENVSPIKYETTL